MYGIFQTMVDGSQVGFLFVVLFLMLAGVGFVVGFVYDIPQLEAAKEFFLLKVTYVSDTDTRISILKYYLC